MGLTMAEQEEGVHWVRTEPNVTIHSWRDAVHKRLTEAGFEPTLIHRLNDEVVGWTWHNVPKALVRVGANGSIRVKGAKRGRGGKGEGGNATPFPRGAGFAKRERSSGKQAVVEG